MDKDFKGGTIRYKCRRCKEFFSGVHVPSSLEILMCIINDYPIPEKHGGGQSQALFPGMHEIHHCAVGLGIGVGDIIGADYD